MRVLTNTSEWVSILEQSYGTPFIIFKHSNLCGASANVQDEMEEVSEEHQDVIYKVVVQDSEEVSNAIASDLEMEHESPQVLIIKNGEALYSASHSDIDKEEIEEEYKNLI